MVARTFNSLSVVPDKLNGIFIVYLRGYDNKGSMTETEIATVSTLEEAATLKKKLFNLF